MITLAKGKTIVVIRSDDCPKVHTFISENKFHPLPSNPINKDQRRIQKASHQCDLIVHRKQIKYLTQKNPSPPTLS